MQGDDRGKPSLLLKIKRRQYEGSADPAFHQVRPCSARAAGRHGWHVLVPEMEFEDSIAEPDRGAVRKVKAALRFADGDTEQALAVCCELVDVLALAQQGVDPPHHQCQVEVCHCAPLY